MISQHLWAIMRTPNKAGGHAMTNPTQLIRALAVAGLLTASLGLQGCVGTIAAGTVGAVGKVAGSTVGAVGHVAGSAVSGGRSQKN